MIRIIFNSAVIALTILFSWHCANENSPLNPNEEILNEEEKFYGKLQIKTEKSEYNLEEVSVENFAVIIAALINTTQDTFYAKLGDGYNASIEQEYLSIAKFTDGYFEKNTYNNWENLNLGSLFEGSRTIRILPSKKYILQATAHLDSNIEGKFRLKVNYYKSYFQTTVDTLSDTSNTFFIYKR